MTLLVSNALAKTGNALAKTLSGIPSSPLSWVLKYDKVKSTLDTG